MIGNRFADFRDEGGQAAVRNERSRPEMLADVVFRYRLRSLGNEKGEQVECLRREPDFILSDPELPGVWIERQVVELQTHGGYYRGLTPGTGGQTPVVELHTLH